MHWRSALRSRFYAHPKMMTPGRSAEAILDGTMKPSLTDGHSVLFTPAYRLMQELLAAKRDLDMPRRLLKLDNFDFLLLDDVGYLPKGAEEPEVPFFTLITERYELRSLGTTLNLVFSELEHIFANPMATAGHRPGRAPLRHLGV